MNFVNAFGVVVRLAASIVGGVAGAKLCVLLLLRVRGGEDFSLLLDVPLMAAVVALGLTSGFVAAWFMLGRLERFVTGRASLRK